MRHSLTAIVLFCCLSTVSSAAAQEPIEDVVVTGHVRKVVLCTREPYTWIYRFSIRMRAKNTGTRSVIISSAQATVVYYKVESHVSELSRGEYAHIGWVTSGPGKDPKSVPGRPVAPFKTVAPGRRVSIDVDFRAVRTRELTPGPVYIQVIAENWPHYSDNYVAKLKQAWQPHGLVWAHSLHSQPISSILPSGLERDSLSLMSKLHTKILFVICIAFVGLLCSCVMKEPDWAELRPIFNELNLNASNPLERHEEITEVEEVDSELYEPSAGKTIYLEAPSPTSDSNGMKPRYWLRVEDYASKELAGKRAAEYLTTETFDRIEAAFKNRGQSGDRFILSKTSVRMWAIARGKRVYALTTSAYIFTLIETPNSLRRAIEALPQT